MRQHKHWDGESHCVSLYNLVLLYKLTYDAVESEIPSSSLSKLGVHQLFGQRFWDVVLVVSAEMKSELQRPGKLTSFQLHTPDFFLFHTVVFSPNSQISSPPRATNCFIQPCSHMQWYFPTHVDRLWCEKLVEFPFNTLSQWKN